MAFVTGQDLAVGYDGRPVASGISFEVSSGDLLCVIGENGAGKSTLVKTLLGLQTPVSGTLSFGDGVRADEVGYLPQRGETQRDFPTSVAEIVLSGCLSRLGWRPFFGAEERRIASESLERVGCTHLKDASFADLSGGQQQRVLIARALCAATRLLVLDEPMTGLDPHASAELYDTIEQLRADGLGVISVSHDVSVATSHASHVLEVGAHTFFGTVAEWNAHREEFHA